MTSVRSWFLKKFSFETMDMRTSYFQFNKEGEIKLLSMMQGTLTAMVVLLTVPGLFLGITLKELPIRGGIIFSSLIIFFLRRRWPTLYKMGFLAFGCGLMYYVMVYVEQIYTSSKNNTFLTGNAFGMIEIISVLSFKALWFRSFAYVVFFLFKIICFYEDLPEQPRTYIQFFACVLQVFFFCVYHDIVDRRNFDIIYKSREKIKKFQDLLSNDLPSSVMVMSANFSSLLYSNKFFQQKFTPGESLGNALAVVRDLFGKFMIQAEEKDVESKRFNHQISLLDYLLQIDLDTLESQELDSVRTLYVSNKDEEGREFQYEIRLRKICWDNIPSYAIVMNDITDKQMVSTLKMIDIQKDLVIATVSHELRTPINGIVGLLEMASELTQDKTLLNYLENCKSCSKLLLYLVNAILDLSQLRNGSLKIVKNTFSLSEMLEELGSLYLYQSHQKGIEFITEKDPSIDEEVYTDKYRLIEILINLLGNAMKFTFHGSVKLKISKNNDRKSFLIFSVEDTGLGIKDQDKNKLFKLFGKVEQTDKNVNTHGAGLGLTIANELVKALNNNDKQEKILFESEYGRGTRFWFQIDVSKPIEADSLPFNHKIEINICSRKFDSQDFAEFSDPSQLLSVKIQKRELCSENNSLLISKEPDEAFLTSKKQYCDRKQILLIDDNPLNLMAAGFILEKLKLSVTKAFNGEEGIRLLEESVKTDQRYCLVLTDIQMPIMDGLEMSKRIKEKIQRKEIYEVPIVALTAKKLDQNEHEKYKECGITCSLEKPLNKSEVENIVIRFLKNDKRKD